MKKIAALLVIFSLAATGYLIMASYDPGWQQGKPPSTGQSDIAQPSSYAKRLEFDQQDLQLQKEVVQYKIEFHQDGIVNVSVRMFVRYIDKTITSEYFLLTDGEKPLLAPSPLEYIPERKYVVVTPRIQLSMGRFLLLKLLNDRGKLAMGASENVSHDFLVHDGDCWYLTMAVPTTADQGMFSVIFKSTNESMESTLLTRHGKVGFYAANYNQFSGKYYSLKLSFLGGFSVCNVNKEASTTTGSIITLTAAGHRRGSMTVQLPNGTEMQSNQEGIIVFNYIGNRSGTWRMWVKGWSVYFRMFVSFLYIDIDPKCSEIYY